MYDVAIVGARCAGAATAMLLARRGYRVLLLDRARFPQDTLSTLFIHMRGVALLERWGVREAVLGTGCPQLTEMSFAAPGVRIEGPVTPQGTVNAVCAPRRYALDAVLAEAAVRAGAEFRQRVSVNGLCLEDGVVTAVRHTVRNGRGEVVERARLVIGADGRHSTVARLAGAPYERRDGKLTRARYTYWSGIAGEAVRLFVAPGAGAAALPTQDGLTLVNVQDPVGTPGGAREDRQRGYLRLLERASPELRQLVAGGRQEERLYSCSDLPNFFRRPWGPGWVLVGDAAYHKDPIGAQGIADAFEQAALLDDCLADGIADAERTRAGLRAYAAELVRRFTGPYEENLRYARLRMSEQELCWLREHQGDPAFRSAFLRSLSGAE